MSSGTGLQERAQALHRAFDPTAKTLRLLSGALGCEPGDLMRKRSRRGPKLAAVRAAAREAA